MYPQFKGGSWLFTWDQLLRVDGYSHAYWGWGQEDDDLGARLSHAGITHAKAIAYPGPRSDQAAGTAAVTDPEKPCTGRVRQCDHDPNERDCGVYPYSRLLQMFSPVPATTLEGLAMPAGRSLVEGRCFVHVHEGGFSRDALEIRPDLQARTSAEFQMGRKWHDVISGRFRRDNTTGLSRLVPARCRGSDIVSVKGPKGGKIPRGVPAWVRPLAGHGFAVLGLESVTVEVAEERDRGRGKNEVARLKSVAPHPTYASHQKSIARNRWSGNDFLARVCDARLGRRRGAVTPDAAAPGGGSSGVYLYNRLRVRLTCDEDAVPWCVDKEP